VTNHRLSPQPLALATRQAVTLPGGRGRRILVRSGCAWLTQLGDARDVVLTAGRALRVDSDAPVVVQMLAAGTVDVGEPAMVRPRLLQRLAGWLRVSGTPAAQY